MTETRWPLELRAIDSATVVAGSVTSIDESNGDLRLVVDLPNSQRTIDVSDSVPNQAVARLRREVEDGGWLLCCNRFHRDASSSAKASGLSCYIGPRWRPLSTSTDLMSSLAPASPTMVVDSAAADELDDQPLALPKRLASAVLVDTSLGRRLWAKLEERRANEHLELYREGSVWFELNVQRVTAQVGLVYRARYRNALSVFFVVTANDGKVVDLRQFAFAVDDPGYVPTSLFIGDNLLDGGFRLRVGSWSGGPFTTTGVRMDPAPEDVPAAADLISLEDLGPRASEAIDVYPSLLRTA